MVNEAFLLTLIFQVTLVIINFCTSENYIPLRADESISFIYVIYTCYIAP